MDSNQRRLVMENERRKLEDRLKDDLDSIRKVSKYL